MEKLRGVRWGFLTLVVLVLAACSGGGGDGDGGIEGTGFVELAGTAAVGKPLADADVEIKDRRGNRHKARTNANGKYSIQVPKDAAPFLVRVRDDKARSYYATAARDESAGGGNIRSNVHPLSDVASRNWFGSRGRSVDDEFDANGEIQDPPQRNEVAAISNAIRTLLRIAYQQYGVGADFDFDTEIFEANGSNFDGLLDNLTVTFSKNKITILLRDPNTGLQAAIVIAFDLSDDLAKPDGNPPTVPGGLATIPSGTTGIAIVWNSSQDDVGVAGYNIYRDGVLIATSPYPVYSDVGLNATTQYCYSVDAFDGAGNTSAKTTQVCATTLAVADGTAPAIPQNLSATDIGATTLALAWQPSPEDDVLGYDVYRGPTGAVNEKIATTIASGYTDIGLSNGTNYCYRVRSFDAALNRSDFGPEICATTSSTDTSGDTTAPTSTATPTGGVFDSPQSVTLSCDDGAGSGCAAIYFTRDGSAPTTLSSIYSQPILISTNTTLRFLAVDKAGNTETTAHSETYVFTRSIGGTVSGLTGNGLVLFNNGGNALAISADGNFTFTSAINSGSTYLVTVATQPSGPTQVCNVSNGSGTAGNTNVTNVAINCTTSAFTISGTISGLTGSGLVLQNNGANDQSIQPNGTTFGFTVPVPSASNYAVTVLTQPTSPAQTCVVNSGSGTVTNSNVTNVSVNCTNNQVPTYSIGGTVTGLTGTVVLQNNGGDNLSVSANGGFTFATPLANSTGYNVSVLTQPSGQTCSVTIASGTVSGAAVTSVSVNCVTDPVGTFSVGGTITGLTGTVVLRNNGADILSRSVDGVFTFATLLANNAPYNVTVLTQPSGQTCTVTSASGTISNASVSDVNVTCVNNPAIGLSVILNPDRVRPGEGVRSTLRVANTSASTINNVVLQATFPPAGVNNGLSQTYLTGGGTCPGTACDRGELVTWNIASLAAGESTVVSMPMGVLTTATDGTIVTVAAQVLVNGTPAASGSASAEVASNNALSLALDQDKGTVAPGSTLTYTLTYGNRNTGTSGAITNATLTLPLPPNVTFVSATNGGSLSGNGVQWAINNLQSSQSGRVQAVVTVNGGVADGILLSVDAAEISGTNSSAVTELARATASTRVHASGALGLVIEMDPDPVRIGEVVRGKLTVTNLSNATQFGTQLVARFPTDRVNSGLSQTYLSGGAICPGSFCDRSELVTWNLGILAAGASVTVEIPVGVSAGTASGTLITLEALTWTDNLSPTTASHTVVVDDDNALSLALDEDKDAIAPGARLTYTLTYGNRNSGTTGAISNATLTLPLPPNVAFVSATKGGTQNGNTIQWSIGNLQSSASGRVQAVVSVNGALADGTILSVDAAEISGSNATTGAEFSRATAATRVQMSPALGLVIEMDPDPVRIGEGVRTKLTVTNQSGTTQFGTQLIARYPTDGVNNGVNQSLVSGGGTCPGGACDRAELVTWNIGQLAAGASTTVELPLGISSGTASGTLITLDALAWTDSLTQTTATHAVVVDSDNALSLALEENKDVVAPGENLTYTLTYGNRNTGTSGSITNATLSLPLPPNVMFVSATKGGTLSGNTVQWDISNLQSSQSGRVQAVVTVNSGLTNGTIVTVNAAEISGSNAITGTEYARATAATRVQSSGTLGLVIEMDPDPVRTGEGVRTRLTVTNLSSATQFGTQLVARFPTDRVNNGLGQTLITGGGICPGGTCDRYEFVTWNIGQLAPGASTTVEMPMVATGGSPSGSLITLTAQAYSDSLAPTHASHSIVIDDDNALSLALSEDTDAIAPGATLTYTLTFGNRNTGTSGAIANATLTLPLPPNVTFVAADGGGTLSGNTVQWTISNLASSESGRVQAVVRVNAGLTNGTILSVDAAELTGTNTTTGTEYARATAATRVLSASPLALSVSVAPNRIGTAQTLTATITAQNTSASDLFNVVLLARFPTDRVNSGMSQANLTGGGTCPAGACDRYELATWSLGTIATGAAPIVVQMPMVVPNGIPLGTLISVEAVVTSDTGSQATASDTAAVGTGSF